MPKFTGEAKMIFYFPFSMMDQPKVIKKLQEYMKEGEERIDEILGVQATKGDLQLTFNVDFSDM